MQKQLSRNSRKVRFRAFLTETTVSMRKPVSQSPEDILFDYVQCQQQNPRMHNPLCKQ